MAKDETIQVSQCVEEPTISLVMCVTEEPTNHLVMSVDKHTIGNTLCELYGLGHYQTHDKSS